jgi:signal transduction histidine kinase
VELGELGLTVNSERSRSRLRFRVGALIGAQLVVAAAFATFAVLRGARIGAPVAVIALTGAFVVTGAFDASIDFRRHRFTFTPSDAVLVVAFFVAGPIGLATAFAVAEAVNMVAQREEPLKVSFNVANRLAVAMVAGTVFEAIGRTSVHDVVAGIAALAAVVVFSLLDIAATSLAVSIAEGAALRSVFVASASTGVLATLAAAPIGLIALDLFVHEPPSVFLLVPVAVAVTLNSRYAVTQHDEHLRFERLYESSGRTEGLLSIDEALRSLAAEARALTTGVKALCCVTDRDGDPVAAWADDHAQWPAESDAIAAALDLADRCAGNEINVADVDALGRFAGGTRSALAASVEHESAGRVVILVLRDDPSDAGAENRVETLGAFANHAALVVANALMHEEVAAALARQVDLNLQKDDFIAAVSHELRTPLAVILGSMETLERAYERIPAEQRAQLFDMAAVQGQRLQRLIDEILLVAAAEHAAVPIDYEVVDVDDLFAAVEADAATATAGRLVRRVEDRVEIVVDRSKLSRVILNLVENAAKYAPSGPIEMIANLVAIDGEQVCIRVVDHGPGIPEADRARVFERFVQLDQSSTRRQGGTGLGLHLGHELAKLLGGTIDLEETDGGGCTFVLVLPTAPATELPTRPEPAATARPAGGVRARPTTFPSTQPVQSVR